MLKMCIRGYVRVGLCLAIGAIFISLLLLFLNAKVEVATATGNPVIDTSSRLDSSDHLVFLPSIFNPSVNYVITNVLENGSFEAGWQDMPPAPGHLINQQPNGWTLEWVELGQPLFGTEDVANGVPECVHKFDYQLPPHEQPGGPDALILDGETTYKIFHGGASFGAELRQTVIGLEPGTVATLTVPIQVHLQGDGDVWSAESGAWANGEGQWVNAGVMGDRTWYEHVVVFMVPEDGTVEVLIRVKSKWNRPKDFFIDDVQLLAATVAPEAPAQLLAGAGHR